MKRYLFICSALTFLLLTACAAQPAAEQLPKQSDGPTVTVYRAPT